MSWVVRTDIHIMLHVSVIFLIVYNIGRRIMQRGVISHSGSQSLYRNRLILDSNGNHKS